MIGNTYGFMEETQYYWLVNSSVLSANTPWFLSSLTNTLTQLWLPIKNVSQAVPQGVYYISAKSPASQRPALYYVRIK